MALLNTFLFIVRHPLNRGRRLRSLGDFVAWQVGSRLVSAPVAVSFVEDTRLLLARGQAGATGNIYTGLHDIAEMAFLLHVIREHDLFVDVGANVGSYTVLAAGVAGAQCISFEPGPLAFDTLTANIALNRIESRVTAHRSAVGDSIGVARFTTGLDAMNHVESFGDDQSLESVPLTTLDSALEGITAYCIKIDVEGFESKVIDGAEETLRNRGLKILILETGAGDRYARSDRELHERIVNLGFEPFAYEPFNRILRKLDERNVYGNTIYIRDAESVAQRISTARRFAIAGGRAI